MERKLSPAPIRAACLLVFAAWSLLSGPVAACADQITSAEGALDRFRAACGAEIKQGVSPEWMTRINALRNAPSLTITVRSPRGLAALTDPKSLTDDSRSDIFGSRSAVTKSTGKVWVLTYDNMTGLTVYLDGTSGSVLWIAFIPEG